MKPGRWPNLFIVGAVKSGTTSLYAYLRQHPAIFFPHMKEPHFFTQPHPSPGRQHLITYVSDEAAYLRLYAVSQDASWRGDASPSYLWCPKAPERIAAASPEARIIVVLRDPVERAYAHYLMDYAEGAVVAPFYDALLADWRRSDKGWGVSQLYVELGFYRDQVKRYWDVFGRDRVLVLLLLDIKKEPRAVLKRIARFLEIPDGPMDAVDTTEIHNRYLEPKGRWVRRVAGHPISRFLGERAIPRRLGVYVWEHWMQKEAEKPPMDSRAVDFLQDIYTDELLALEALFGCPLPELRRSWRRVGASLLPSEQSPGTPRGKVGDIEEARTHSVDSEARTGFAIPRGPR